MSDFFDDVARRVAEPMPRRRAIRIVLGAAVGVAVGTRQVPTALAITCPPPQYHCDCPSINGLFYRWCCSPNQDCKCTPPPNGGAYCECKPSQKCGSACCDVGDKCGDPKTGRCCKPHEVPCGETCCAPGTECANADIGYCCGPRQRACQGKKTVTCCLPNQACCDGTCCAPGLRCHKGKCQICPPRTRACGDHCCERGEDCCNGHCCKKGQKCCYEDHCCDKDETCCGETCCAKGEKCCGDHCCGKDQECCDKGCCAKGTHCASLGGRTVCCPSGRSLTVAGATVCCAKGQVVSGDRCCPKNIPNCVTCDPACGAREFCVNGVCLPI